MAWAYDAMDGTQPSPTVSYRTEMNDTWWNPNVQLNPIPKTFCLPPVRLGLSLARMLVPETVKLWSTTP